MEQLSSNVSEEAIPHHLPARFRWQLGIALLALGCGLVAFAGWGVWQKYQATHNPRPLPDGDKTVTHSIAQPDETPIDDQSDYLVPPNQPRKIDIPSINTSGFIQKVGIDQNGAVTAPDNVHVAGWFVGRAVPGQPGLSIIDGHVQGVYTPGIFKNLSQLKPGDNFRIEFGDYSVKKFEVVSVNSYTTDEAARHLFKTYDDIEAQLNLITCSGSYNVASRQYDQRLLVVSRRL